MDDVKMTGPGLSIYRSGMARKLIDNRLWHNRLSIIAGSYYSYVDLHKLTISAESPFHHGFRCNKTIIMWPNQQYQT